MYIEIMKWRRRFFRLMVAVIVVSLIGLLAVQVYLLSSALELKEQTLRTNALGALANVAQQLEVWEAVSHTLTIRAATGPVKGRWVSVTTQLDEERISMRSDSASQPAVLKTRVMPLSVSGDTVHYRVETPQRVLLRMHDMAENRDTVLVDTFKTPGDYAIAMRARKFAEGFFYEYTADSSTVFVEVGKGGRASLVSPPASGKEKQELVNRVVNRLVVAEREPIETRVKPVALDSLLRVNLRDAGVPADYAYGIVAETDSLPKLVHPENYAQDLLASQLRTRLFPADIFSPRHDLVLYFPSQGTFLLQQIWPQLAATVVFMAIIVFSFIYTLRTIVEQKRVAHLMTDFINNMTHEFKTPLSTVALAVEAILRPDVIARREKIRRYSGIIMEENGRMRKQVDKILQMAVLERGEYDLRMTALDAHEILTTAIEGIALQVEERKGTLTRSFEARSSTVEADPLHFANVINNLLDNANKYSPDIPRILISTHNADGMLVIRITDNGIGILPEDLPKVFDKYYRVPTGNVHDVKGFGLGLSYVKLMVTAMGGEVGMTSKYGEGTTTEVRIPTENGARGTGNGEPKA